MASRSGTSGSAGGVSGVGQYLALEGRLVLLAWLNRRFGYERNRDLLADLKEAAEGFDGEGRSYAYHRLRARGDRVRIPEADLARYDENIRRHLRAMNAHRTELLTLRYFQYAAALYTEHFLDMYFHRQGEMLRSLNQFVMKRNAATSSVSPKDARFSEADLSKLAFWMATGSGKTLIMHLNYRQFLHYNNRPLDNILLITPNEGLSEQHMAEMEESDIVCRRFELGANHLVASGRDAVQVIEITKLVKAKRGGGVSVPVEAFEGNNLVFVDEGHKGAGGEAWRGFRDALAETGFTFEYSATFGQALTAARNDQLTQEYGKAIVFDYSYRYFHEDGYGKDFRVLNLREDAMEKGTRTLLLGNLLSFYEQQRVFEEHEETLRPYNLENPLWVFVGGTVNAVRTEGGQKRSDVLTVVRFLHQILGNQGNWAVEAIDDVLKGKTGLRTPDGRDVFEDGFRYLRESSMTPEQMYYDILARILRTPTSSGLHLASIRGNADEIGLKAGGAEEYFGLIYIGDTAAFRKLVEQDDSGIEIEQDAIAGSLFDRISTPDTTINVLIGAKKFMEGWNSWRVSNMGLLNVGRSEGSEIIQLFGRGVRLRGRDLGLKRSKALDGEHPDHVDLLETLNIFAVRANYMTQFREYLEREGVEPEGAVELPLFIKPNRGFLRKGLVVPRVPEGRDFAGETDLLLERASDIRVQVDMSLKVQVFMSGDDGMSDGMMTTGQERPIPDESLDLVDWQQVYLELLAYKEDKGLVNLAIRPETAREIMAPPANGSSPSYTLIADESVVEPSTFTGAALLHDAVISILRKYVDSFYRVRQKTWESQNMVYRPLESNDGNFRDYLIKVDRGQTELIDAIRALIDEADAIYHKDAEGLPSIHFDRHLYQPLLIERADGVRSDPPGLKPSERQFVEDMREYCQHEKEGVLAGREIYLLRNLERGKGVGFFDGEGFYPDFILWIKDDSGQRIVFVEPHGMRHSKPYRDDVRAQLHESLPEMARKISRRSKVGKVTLDSFIVSATRYEDLHPYYEGGTWDRERFTQAHILFLERNEEYDYLALMMEQS